MVHLWYFSAKTGTCMVNFLALSGTLLVLFDIFAAV